MRLCAIPNGYLNGGCPPASVPGGYREFGSCDSSLGFFGPNSCLLISVSVSRLMSIVSCARARFGRLADGTGSVALFLRNERRLITLFLVPLFCSVTPIPPIPIDRNQDVCAPRTYSPRVYRSTSSQCTHHCPVFNPWPTG